MNYQTEIDRYKRMYDSLPCGKWVSRRLVAWKIDRLMQERSKGRLDGVVERFIEGFSYASKFPKPEFKPEPHAPRFIGNTPADNARFQEDGNGI